MDTGIAVLIGIIIGLVISLIIVTTKRKHEDLHGPAETLFDDQEEILPAVKVEHIDRWD